MTYFQDKQNTWRGCLARMPDFCGAHLDFLAVYVDQPLPEVHPDRGLCFLGEPPGAEAVGEARLADTGVPDHDDFKDAGPRRREGRARQRTGEFHRRAALCHLTRTEVLLGELGEPSGAAVRRRATVTAVRREKHKTFRVSCPAYVQRAFN